MNFNNIDIPKEERTVQGVLRRIRRLRGYASALVNIGVDGEYYQRDLVLRGYSQRSTQLMNELEYMILKYMEVDGEKDTSIKSLEEQYTEMEEKYYELQTELQELEKSNSVIADHNKVLKESSDSTHKKWEDELNRNTELCKVIFLLASELVEKCDNYKENSVQEVVDMFSEKIDIDIWEVA